MRLDVWGVLGLLVILLGLVVVGGAILNNPNAGEWGAKAFSPASQYLAPKFPKRQFFCGTGS